MSTKSYWCTCSPPAASSSVRGAPAPKHPPASHASACTCIPMSSLLQPISIPSVEDSKVAHVTILSLYVAVRGERVGKGYALAGH